MPTRNPAIPLPPSCGLFSSRDTLEEALAYSNELILSAVPAGAPRQAALTALHVTSNTAIKLLSEYEIRKPGADTKQCDMTKGEAMYFLRKAAPALGKLSFDLRDVYPAGSEVLGLVMTAIMQLTDLSSEELIETVMQKGKKS